MLAPIVPVRSGSIWCDWDPLCRSPRVSPTVASVFARRRVRLGSPSPCHPQFNNTVGYRPLRYTRFFAATQYVRSN
eukprot:4450918-Pyramimonas_sp.AAC.1